MKVVKSLIVMIMPTKQLKTVSPISPLRLLHQQWKDFPEKLIGFHVEKTVFFTLVSVVMGLAGCVSYQTSFRSICHIINRPGVAGTVLKTPL